MATPPQDAQILEETKSPTLAPAEGIRSSKGIMEFGIKVGHLVVHRGPTEWLLDHIPDHLAGPIRKIVAKGMREAGERALLSEKHLQESMNGKLFMNTEDPATGQQLLAELPDDYLGSLFPHGQEDKWPKQLIVCTKDVRPDPAMLRKIMFNLEGIIGDVVEKPLTVAREFDAPTAGKTVIIGAYDTQNDILGNSAAVLERTQVIKKDPLSIDGICLAAQTAGQALLDIATLNKDAGTVTLRDDAPEIFRHVMSHGFSQGGNIATDIFRFIRHELHSGRYELALDAKGHETVPTDSDAQIKQILGGAHIYIIAGADVPLTKDELQSLPPRDHSRGDGDIIISAAVGTNRKQENYSRKWDQHAPNLHRGDRFLETLGPQKKLFGILEKPGGYHSYLGHGEDDYRTSIVHFSKDALAERWLPRFADRVIASDITFNGDVVHLDFDHGTNPDVIRDKVSKLVEHLDDKGITVVSDVFPENPYHLQVELNPNEDTLGAVREGFKKAKIGTAEEVHYVLHMDEAVEWLKGRLSKLPDLHINVEGHEEGPVLEISPSSRAAVSVGGHLHQMLNKGLERIGIETKDRQTISGEALEIPFDEVVAAIKDRQKHELAESRNR